MRFPDALTPLRDRRFAWYYAGRFISTTGSTMAPVALTFAVLDLVESPSVPMVLFLLVGGVVADRFSRSMVMQVSHLLSAATQGAVAYLFITGTAELWMIVVLEAVNGIVLAFTFPAMASVVPQLTPRSHLQQANALLSFSRGGLAILGPTVAALLVVTVGPGWALAVDATAWLVAAFCMSRIRIPAARRADGTSAPSMIREMREGWSAFVEHTWLCVIVVAFGIINAIRAGAWLTLAPALAKTTIGESGWGYVLSAESLGLVLMTLVMLKLRLRYPLRAGMMGAGLFSVPLLMMGLDPQVLALVLAAFVAGTGIEVFSIGWSVALQENIDERVLSRVYSYDALGSFVAMPVGQLVYGPLGEAFGIRDVLMVSGFLVAGVCALTLLSSSVWKLERVKISCY